MNKLRIAVIGGGASGMLAAITAAGEGAEVCIYEANDRVGKKILATGNGKCNFSNTEYSSSCYYGEDKKSRDVILRQFDADDTIAFFRKAGMLICNKKGYLYPASEQASTVLDILRMQLRKKDVQIFVNSMVKKIHHRKDGLYLVETSDSKLSYDRVILTCGGRAAPKTGSDGNGYRLAQALGHTLVPVVPALVQLQCSEAYLKSVAGVRQNAKVSLVIEGKRVAMEQGELQLTAYGISGIVVFQISRLAAYGLLHKEKVTAYIDCLPDFTQEEYSRFTQSRKEEMDDISTVEEFFTGMLNKKLMLLFIKLAGLKPEELIITADHKKIDYVFALCREFPLTVSGCNSFDHAQVCAGGVPLREVSKHLESLYKRGLFLAGEILDVDGKCGGYNLQWAWASGYVSGINAAKPDKEQE